MRVFRHVLKENRLQACLWLAARILLLLPSGAMAQDSLGDSVRAAVKQVEPSIVRIQVIGGGQNVEGQEVSSQVTTGVVVDSSGAILSSQFAFSGEVDAVLVETPAGQRRPARVVATDFIRRLVLLQAEGTDWTPAAAASDGAVRIGLWAIAAGRFHSADQCNLSVGIVSAKGRVHGLALQTDAKISPVNYGGPLLDLDGRILGLLVPLSPAAGGAMSGVEWYDSGIGFAIPWPDALRAAERLKSGTDVKPGKLGLRVAAAGPFSTSVTIEKIVRGGPADQAGLQVADQIVGVDSQPVTRVAVLEEAVARSSAGDRLVIHVRRGERELSLPVTLAASIPVPDPAWLGLLPAGVHQAGRPAAQDPEESPGVPAVVIEPSPAAGAGMTGQVRVMRINGVPVNDRKQMETALSSLETGVEFQITYRSPADEADRQASVTATAPERIVPEPTAAFLIGIAGTDAEAVSGATRKVWEFGERGRGVVFSMTSPAGSAVDEPEPLPAAPVVLLSAFALKEEEILAAWQPYLHSRRLVILIPHNPEGGALTEDDQSLVIACLQRAGAELKVDFERTTLVAGRTEAALAWRLATSGMLPVRGVALMNGWFSAADIQSAEGAGCAVLLPAETQDAQSMALLSLTEKSLRAAGFPTMRMRSGNPEASIADWTLRLSAF